VHKKDSLNGRELEALFEDIRIEIEVKEIPKIKRIGRLDHLCPKKAVKLFLELWVWRKKTESVPLRRIGGHDTDSS